MTPSPVTDPIPAGTSLTRSFRIDSEREVKSVGSARTLLFRAL